MPVSAVAQLSRSNGQSELLRENLRSMASISGRLEGRDLGSAVADIRREMQKLKLPVGYTYEIGGQYESQRQAFRELLMVFGIGTFLVLTVLLVHFRAFVPATLILDRGAALAVRRAAAAGPHRHGSERLVGDGAHSADRTGGQERHHAARFLRDGCTRRASRSKPRSRTPAGSGSGRF